MAWAIRFSSSREQPASTGPSFRIFSLSPWVSFATGLAITLTQFILNAVLKISFENAVLKYFCGSSINAGMLAMVVGLVLVPVVSMLTKKPDMAKVNAMFDSYDHKVTVPASKALGDEK